MKKHDIIIFCALVTIIALFLFIPGTLGAFRSANSTHGYLLSFIKFAILATFGEMLALRIGKGHYWHPGFGLLAKMLVWGILGILIKIAFGIFASGTPNVLASLGFPVTPETLVTGSVSMKILTAFSISTATNLIFAPLMMTIHKITDSHIQQTGGKFSALLSIDFAKTLEKIDWETMWHFIFKKTIPLFWIPAHTVTFLLPAEFRVLFAAVLGIMLGLILAFAGNPKTTARGKEE